MHPQGRKNGQDGASEGEIPKFDGAGYDKDLVEALERDIVSRNPGIHWSVFLGWRIEVAERAGRGCQLGARALSSPTRLPFVTSSVIRGCGSAGQLFFQNRTKILYILI